MVSVNEISKSYTKGGAPVVNDVSLEIESGELFGLIGPDGAGKTTLFRILTTLLLPDKGTATVDGLDIVKEYDRIRKRIGYMPGKFSLYQDLTVEENLDFFATLFGTTRQDNYHLIKDIYAQIEPFRDRRAGKLSGGMKQKLALSCALIHRPSALFLDEPTTGVDPVSRKEFWQILKRLKTEGITIFVSTPYMDEATLCDRIALFESGSILATDSPEGIVAEYPDTLYAIRSPQMARLLIDLRAYENTRSCFPFGEYIHMSFRNEHPGAVDELRSYAIRHEHYELEVKQIEATVEDCFIRLLTNNE